MALVIIWLKLPKVWRAFAYVSVASGLIKSRVLSGQNQEASEWGQGPDYFGLNSELQNVGFLFGCFCFSKVLDTLLGKGLFRAPCVDSYIFHGLKSRRSWGVCLKANGGQLDTPHVP